MKKRLFGGHEGRYIRPVVEFPENRKRRYTPALIAIILLGIVVGAFSSTNPSILVVIGLITGISLFVLVFNNIQFGILLGVFLNCTIPQSGPTWNLGMEVAIAGESRGLHFNLHEIVFAMVLAAWIIKILLKQADWKKSSPFLIPVIIFFLNSWFACMVGQINGGDELVIAFRFVRVVVFVYIFFVFINNITTRKQLKQLFVTMMIASMLVSGLGVAQKVLGQGWSEWVAENVFTKLGFPEDVNYVAGASLDGEQAFRLNSTFLHPNTLGAYNILILPFFISLFWYYKKRRERLWLATGLVLNLICLFYTGSRAAWFGGAVIALAYGLFGFMDRRMILAGITVVLMIATIAVLFHPPKFVEQRFSSVSAEDAKSVRIAQYLEAIDIFMERPIFGIGMGMEGTKIITHNIRVLWAAVENVFITFLVTHGIVGLTTFLLLFFVQMGMMLVARAQSVDDPFIKYHAEALFMSTLGWLIAGQFGAWMIFSIFMWTLFWIILSTSACLYNDFREGRQEESPLEPPVDSEEEPTPGLFAGPGGEGFAAS